MDAGYYMGTTRRWLEGDFVSKCGKPGYHLLTWGAAKLIGFFDDTISYLNCAMDVLNIVILYGLSVQMRMGKPLALAAVVTYGCLPIIFGSSHWGLAHLPSITFLLGSIGMFLFFLDQRRFQLLFLYLCGCFAAFAGMVHPTAYAAVPLYPALILLEGRGSSFLKRIGQSAVPIGSYMIGVLSTLLMMVAILAGADRKWSAAAETLIQGLPVHYSKITQGVMGPLFPDRILASKQTAYELMTRHFLIFMGLVFLIRIFLYFKLPGKESTKSPVRHLRVIGAFVLSYTVLNVVIDKTMLARLLIPVAPPLILGTFGLLDQCLSSRWRFIGYPIFVASLFMAHHNFTSHPDYFLKPTTPHRQMREQLPPRIGPSDRVLYYPEILYPKLVETLYLDSRWLYRLKGPWIPRLRELREFHIRYIVLERRPWAPAPADRWREMARMNRINKQRLIRWLNPKRAKQIHQGREFSIFELKYPVPPNKTPIPEPKFHHAIHKVYGEKLSAILRPIRIRKQQNAF